MREKMWMNSKYDIGLHTCLLEYLFSANIQKHKNAPYINLKKKLFSFIWTKVRCSPTGMRKSAIFKSRSPAHDFIRNWCIKDKIVTRGNPTCILYLLFINQRCILPSIPWRQIRLDPLQTIWKTAILIAYIQKRCNTF